MKLLSLTLVIVLGILFAAHFIIKPKQMNIFKREKTTSDVDKELEVYKREKIVFIDKDIQSRKELSWSQVDNARMNKVEKTLQIEKEISELESKKFALQEWLKTAKEGVEQERNSFNTILKAKDAEIQRLIELSNKIIDTSNKILITFSSKK